MNELLEFNGVVVARWGDGSVLITGWGIFWVWIILFAVAGWFKR